MFKRFFSFASKSASPKDEKILDGHRYCPSCGDEYRADIESCAKCKVALITEEEKIRASAQKKKRTRESMQITENAELTAIQRGSLLEMKEIKRVLEKEMIGSVLVADDANCQQSCCGQKTFTLKVKKEDVEDVGPLLVQKFRQATALHGHEIKEHITGVFDQRATTTCCPACGATFVPKDRTCPECGLCF